MERRGRGACEWRERSREGEGLRDAPRQAPSGPERNLRTAQMHGEDCKTNLRVFRRYKCGATSSLCALSKSPLFAPSSMLKRGTAPSVFASPGLQGTVFLYRASRQRSACRFFLVFTPVVGCTCGAPIALDLRLHTGSPAVYLSGTGAPSPRSWHARRSNAPRPGAHSNFGPRSRGGVLGRQCLVPAPPPASTLGRSRQNARLLVRSAAPHQQRQRPC
ncbi:hypothetical protein NDU88_007746 [Pleurodeles waltl]|uniref:Uncharacterized protein n=1 Tax=Pleurodeles waltl TaxID=8319 RepID=A0AAV7VTG2_PLEWA|nr:hypothetical protein NDU88_007746 [Pleurodeles waltl]